jgi:hypothetical protein
MSFLFNFMLTKKARGFRIGFKGFKKTTQVQSYYLYISNDSRLCIFDILTIFKTSLDPVFLSNCSGCVSMYLCVSGCIKGFLR